MLVSGPKDIEKYVFSSSFHNILNAIQMFSNLLSRLVVSIVKLDDIRRGNTSLGRLKRPISYQLYKY